MRFAFALACGLAFCLGCNNSNQPSAQSPAKAQSGHQGTGPIKIVATVGMVADIVREVGGAHVDVSQICGPGVDPHLYKATRDDVAALSSADMIFYSGLMLEGKMSDTLVKMARARPVVAVTESIDVSLLLEPEDFQGHYDPHVWMDVSAWSKCVDAVSAALSEFDSVHAAHYEGNANAYKERLVALHEYGVKAIGSIPEGSRVLVTSHDAFNYLGRAYGLDVQGVQGISTESEAGLQRVSELVDMLVNKNVKAVFIESSVPRKSIDSLIEGARAKGHDVSVGGELFSDAMGKDGTYEGTYVGMLDHNITTIARALGGEAPEKGLHGKLHRD
jgi:manganese/zinc/iron transport system substrate-binding protein